MAQVNHHKRPFSGSFLGFTIRRELPGLVIMPYRRELHGQLYSAGASSRKGIWNVVPIIDKRRRDPSVYEILCPFGGSFLGDSIQRELPRVDKIRQ